MYIKHEVIDQFNMPVLEEIVKIIVTYVNPDKIILFGSYARGVNHEKSDIDLLILKKGLKKQRETINTVYKAFFDHKINIPVDILAVDYDKYFDSVNTLGYVYSAINNEGKTIYETI